MDDTKLLSGARASSGSLVDLSDAAWNPVVLDCGSGLIKAGYAADEQPTHIVPSVVYRPDSKDIDSVDDIAASLEAVSLSTGATPDSIAKKRRIEHCMERGKVKSWDDIEHLWHWLFSEELKKPASDSNIVLTHSSSASPADKGVAATILFEQFACQSVSVLDEAPLALLATTTSDTGIILDSGAELTTASVVYNGCVSTSNISSLQLGGRDLTKYIATLIRKTTADLKDELKKSVFSVAKWSKNYGYFQSLDKIKRDLCRVSMSVDYGKLLRSGVSGVSDPLSSPVSYTLPDGSVVPIAQSTVYAPELLFNPSVVGDATMNEQFGERMYDGIVGLAKNSLDLASGFRSKDSLITSSKPAKKVTAIPETSEVRGAAVGSPDGTDPELYRLLLRNVSVCGGNTMFPGLRERFQSELAALVAESGVIPASEGSVSVVASENRQYASWLGAAVIAEMTDMRDEVFVTRDEYMEQGTTAVFRKCI